MVLAEQWRPTHTNTKFDIPTQVKVVKLPRNKRRLSLDKRRVTPDIDSLTSSFAPTSTGRPHLSRRSSAKDGSFRGGSLKNVMEDTSYRSGDEDEDEIKTDVHKLLPDCRRFSDNEDAKNNNEPQQKKRPSWSRSRSAGKNGSFRNNSMRSLGGSLKNVLEDIEAADDMNSLHPDYDEQQVWAEKKDREVTGAGKRRPSWSTKSGSFRNRSLKSIRTNASSSSVMSSSGSDNIRESIDISETRTSIDIMDFGVSQNNRFMNYREGSDATSISNSQRSLGSTVSSRGLVDSDGFLGWGGGSSSKNIHIDLNPSATKQVGGKKKEVKDEDFDKSGTSIVGDLLEDCYIQLDTKQGLKKEGIMADVLDKRNHHQTRISTLPTPQLKSKSRSKLLRRLSSSFSTTSLSKSISASLRRSTNSEDSTFSTNLAPRSFRKSTGDDAEDVDHDVNIDELRKDLVRKSGRRSSWTDICVETLFSS